MHAACPANDGNLLWRRPARWPWTIATVVSALWISGTLFEWLTFVRQITIMGFAFLCAKSIYAYLSLTNYDRCIFFGGSSDVYQYIHGVPKPIISFVSSTSAHKFLKIEQCRLPVKLSRRTFALLICGRLLSVVLINSNKLVFSCFEYFVSIHTYTYERS